MIHEILDVMTDLWISLWEEQVAQFEVDSVTFWEDMCFRSGPLISPKMFQAFLSPRYKRLTDAGRAMGIKHYLVDSDGDMRKLIPLWMEAGITGVYPFEVQAGMNVEEIGKAISRPGGHWAASISARSILGPEAIDRELEKRMPFLLQRGGFIPTLDHHVTPEVSWADFVYYRKKVAQTCEACQPACKTEITRQPLIGENLMSGMSPIERILRAMRRQKPDRVPREAVFTIPVEEEFRLRTYISDYETYFGMDRRTVQFRRPQPAADFSELPERPKFSGWGLRRRMGQPGGARFQISHDRLRLSDARFQDRRRAEGLSLSRISARSNATPTSRRK